ncbi:MAG: magnesium transporter [Bdellovibrionales bacterium]|nr:magnesium transporter [Bdellovibrionales bacterium]
MKLNPSNTSIIKRLLVGRKSRPLLSLLSRLEPADLASLFSSLDQRESKALIDALLAIDKVSETLILLPEQRLEKLLTSLSMNHLQSIVAYSSDEDAAHFLSLLDLGERNELLAQLEAPKRARVQLFLDYPEDSAGRIMETQIFSLNVNLTAAQGLDELRSAAQKESIYYIYCTNDDDQLVGVVSLRGLATAPSTQPIAELIKRDIVSVTPQTPADHVARLVSHYDFIAVPVVGENNRLLGIVTVDDVLDIIQQEATADIYARAGLQEDDRVYTPALMSIRNRIPWMILNLGLAAIASSVISLFEETMSQLIILASLKNIVAGMGGNTAIQTLTVVTRGLATGDFRFVSTSKVIIKECLVGMSIGLTTGICAGLLTYFWKGSMLVSLVIVISLFLNSLVASLAGAVVPVILRKFQWDPAVGSGVLVTMITDIFGFCSFLGIATFGLYLIGNS